MSLRELYGKSVEFVLEEGSASWLYVIGLRVESDTQQQPSVMHLTAIATRGSSLTNLEVCCRVVKVLLPTHYQKASYVS